MLLFVCRGFMISLLNIEGNIPHMAGNDPAQEPPSIVITFPDCSHVFILGYLYSGNGCVSVIDWRHAPLVHMYKYPAP
jgi:hypothetical protein